MKKKQFWSKLGLLIKPTKKNFSQTHCMLPTPIKLSKDKFRVFFATRNKKNQSIISYCDISFKKKIKIRHNNKISLSLGTLGAFDDNGVLPSSIIKNNNKYFLYYIGWQPRKTTSYSLLPGLAISKNLSSFTRFSKSPILFNNDYEPYSILTAPFVLKLKNNNWFMWYVSCEKWVNSRHPKYNVKLALSKNGYKWKQTHHVCIQLKKNERAIARPYVIFEKNKFKMWYSFEKKIGTYKIGYAESKDGKKWKRMDNLFNFTSGKSFYDNKMQEYPAIIRSSENQYILYNGNNYGKYGINFASKKIFLR